MENVITIDSENVASAFGNNACQYLYIAALRKVLDGLYESAKRSTNRYFVLESGIVRAAQSTKAGALHYMADGRILVEIELA